VRCGTTNPSVSHARKADDEMPTRRATSLMRSGRRPATFPDTGDKFFLLDTASGFL
jgi:hypothetical protein